MSPRPISILGIGYVGMVQTACLSDAGVDVILFDAKPFKNELVRRGDATVVEPGVPEAIARNRRRIQVPETLAEVIAASDVTYICVGTPPQADGSVGLKAVFGVAHEVAPLIRTKPGYHLFVIRSTIPPGTSREFIKIVEAESGKKYGQDFGCIMHPEFMREGQSMEDFRKPSFTILGTDRKEDARQIEELYHRAGVQGETFTVSFEEAELFKYLNNNFHALKVAFANEVARMAKHYNFDPVRLMRIFVRDTKLNVSPYYLMPSMPFGGYCLPKDARGLRRLLEHENIDAATIASLIPSNEQHYAFVFSELEKLIESESKVPSATLRTSAGQESIVNNQSSIINNHPAPSPRLGLWGVAFKRQTDDLRESPYLHVFRHLKSRGYTVKFYDPLINPALIVGANLAYIESQYKDFFNYQIPAAEDFLADTDIVIVGSGNGLAEALSQGMPLQNKKVICLDPWLYDALTSAEVKFSRII
ncbi:MAG: nucleotide sugar dehydrogenase [Candidatus Liptonbacteria bacterium]|nr:nucleotide sugar dehydrogenase [Candidatus Liptonbacteria bacterium]